MKASVPNARRCSAENFWERRLTLWWRARAFQEIKHSEETGLGEVGMSNLLNRPMGRASGGRGFVELLNDVALVEAQGGLRIPVPQKGGRRVQVDLHFDSRDPIHRDEAVCTVRMDSLAGMGGLNGHEEFLGGNFNLSLFPGFVKPGVEAGFALGGHLDFDVAPVAIVAVGCKGLIGALGSEAGSAGERQRKGLAHGRALDNRIGGFEGGVFQELDGNCLDRRARDELVDGEPQDGKVRLAVEGVLQSLSARGLGELCNMEASLELVDCIPKFLLPTGKFMVLGLECSDANLEVRELPLDGRVIRLDEATKARGKSAFQCLRGNMGCGGSDVGMLLELSLNGVSVLLQVGLEFRTQLLENRVKLGTLDRFFHCVGEFLVVGCRVASFRLVSSSHVDVPGSARAGARA